MFAFAYARLTRADFLSNLFGRAFIKQAAEKRFGNCHFEQSEKSRSENKGLARFLVAGGSSE
jgi:hypothetical protein